MAEFMTGMKRTDYCGDLRIGDVGREVTVCGWVQRCRDLGQLIFIDLRDRTGIVQLAFNDKTDKEIFDKAFSCRSEFVLAAKGVVCERSSKNSEIPTGDIEVVVSDMRVLSKAQTPPFEIVDDTNTNEELRLKYRYLDLRRRPLLNNLMMRSKIAKVARDYFHDNGFVEIETPMMIKSTPEGARDYLVPSRIHNGKFYALPHRRFINSSLCFRALTVIFSLQDASVTRIFVQTVSLNLHRLIWSFHLLMLMKFSKSTKAFSKSFSKRF